MNKAKIFLKKTILSIFNIVYKIQLLRYKKKRKKVLLYTDSRGTEIDSFYKQRNPYFSYIKYLKNYEVVYKFCPHKFTSILDFLDYYNNSDEVFDFVILHCGIVDFAPRPLSSYHSMLETKYSYLVKRNWLQYFLNREDFLCDYEDEKTLQFMTLEFLENKIVPELQKINGLIYVGVNRVLENWDGNYWRKRPSCINQQLVQDQLIMSKVPISIDFCDWSDDDIKKYTVDNVHYNGHGLEHIGEQLYRILTK
ncbi:hypothetical protein [Shewanella zhangzhouensis]|uniref:hypothetical protein n=1 Tax=Shewanella zhangzhouensis TaxID=2864213 RepID=UPI001C6579AE|nr:hypothetical protein [Shewanella zhangzhouensis]QYK03919.1 hypothetical protein K0H63_12590 [Shewanella zhangzhouensis]